MLPFQLAENLNIEDKSLKKNIFYGDICCLLKFYYNINNIYKKIFLDTFTRLILHI